MATPRQTRVTAAIILATLAVCAFFLAQGTTRVLAGELLGGAAPAKANPPARVASSSPSFLRRRDSAIILRRNIFDSERGDLTAEPLPEIPMGEDGKPLEEYDPNRPAPKCAGKLKLVGSVMNPDAPDWSFAAIAGTSDGKTMLYRKGSDVEGSRILAVNSWNVLMTGTGGVCQLPMFEEEDATPGPRPPIASKTPAKSPTSARDARKAGLSDEELTEGIEKISDTKFNIQRSMVDKVLANQGSLMKSARVIPHEENGRVVGVKLYGIRRNSLLGRLGIRNGDMLRTINGFDMTSPDTALEAYSRLRSADKLTLAVKRQSKEMTIDYNIE